MSTVIALTIAGSDSGGGAGIQADLKTFSAYGVFGTSAITAVTAQNTVGVVAVHAVPASIVREQIEAVARDFDIAACKSGMLATRELVETVATAIRVQKLGSYVVDPVMVASSGDRLLADDAVGAIRDQLLPLCTLVTPNLDEAGLLAGMAVHDVASMREAATRLVDSGAHAALVKGGHLAAARLVDVLLIDGRYEIYEHDRIETSSTHGTGCTLSAAVTACLARGDSILDAVSSGLDFVRRAIATAPHIGHGHGPLNQLISPRASAED